jgi:hypothetical protein
LLVILQIVSVGVNPVAQLLLLTPPPYGFDEP